MKLVIIIPAYNEEGSIGLVIKGILQALSGIQQKEVIVINDGSTDKTAQIAKEAGAEVVSHLENKGVGAAFSTGVEEALSRKADLVLTIDADNQFNPFEIPKLIQPILEKKADFVTGSRFMKGVPAPSMPKIKLFGNKLMAWFVSRICNRRFSDVSCGFRSYSREALLRLNLFGQFTYTQETILNLCFKDLGMIEVSLKARYFPGRRSYVTGNLVNYVFQTMKIICRTIIDYKPFKFFGVLGIFLFLIGLILDIIMLFNFFQTGSFIPYKFVGISGVILNISGLILFIVGLVANMLNRVRQNQERILYYQKKKLYYAREN